MSGVVHGLTRARGFTQDDSHIFCTPDQLQAELASLLQFVIGLLRDYGLTDFTADLSTRPDEVDDSDDRMQKKIRNAQLQKVPFMLIAGDQDISAAAVSIRYRSGDQDNGVPVDDAVARVVDAVEGRVQV